jgi:DNA-binding transcriptional ArsR family regulator
MHMKQLDQAFAALADPTRRGIVVHLARSGEASVSELVDRFTLTQPTISSHLKVLESAGLISRRKEAQLRPCKLVPERLKAVTDWLEEVQEMWEASYKQLDVLLAELKQGHLAPGSLSRGKSREEADKQERKK